MQLNTAIRSLYISPQPCDRRHPLRSHRQPLLHRQRISLGRFLQANTLRDCRVQTAVQPAVPQVSKMAPGEQLPKVLISNDDGVAAPGLRELVYALHESSCCEVYVCGPADERSAQSHSITLKTYLETWDIAVPGAIEAYAVCGTPADSVMLALNSPIFSAKPTFDLVVSGINRGDNAGLHVIYSGTVGAAREAACKGVRALALSLDFCGANSMDDYATSAKHAVPIIRAMLGQLPMPDSVDLRLLDTCVININFPRDQTGGYGGYCITTQGDHCVLPKFEPFTVIQSISKPEDVGGGRMEARKVRQWKNTGNFAYRKPAEGTDYWAVTKGWVSVCPIGIYSDLSVDEEEIARRQAILSTVQEIVQAAATSAALPCKL